MKRFILIVLGWSFLVLGIAGLFLPVLQGILFIVIGLTLLATEYSWARRWVTHLAQRFPAVNGKVQKVLADRAKYIPGYEPPASGE